MKKKILALCLVVCLAATAIVGATLAYFTDTESKVNTMVIGNVSINIDEFQHNGTSWEKYVDNYELYPLENDQGIALYNKSVRTYNTSSAGEAVYIRSIILIEANALVTANATDCCFPGIHVANDINEGPYTSSIDGKPHYGSKEVGHLDETVTVDGKEYWVIWYVVGDETTAIPAGAALSSLHSVWMDENVTQEQLKGWGDDGVQIIAFSQGIQAAGLTHAEAMAELGEITVEYVEALEIEDDAVINDAN